MEHPGARKEKQTRLPRQSQRFKTQLRAKVKLSIDKVHSYTKAIPSSLGEGALSLVTQRPTQTVEQNAGNRRIVSK